ncbi:MAG: LssY C-terminal domain-containing protein [Acidobacteriota bacterium]
MRFLPFLLAALACAQTPSPALLIANKAEGSLVIVDPKTNAIKGRVNTGYQPHEVAVSADGKFAYVTNYGDAQQPGSSLSVIDLTSFTERRVGLGDLRRPHGIFYSNGMVYFTAEQSRAVARYDPATNKIDWTQPTTQNATHMVLLNKAGTRLFTANIASNTISIFDPTPTGQWRGEHVAVGPGPEALDLSPNERELWTAHSGDGGVSILNIETHAVTMLPKIVQRPNRLKFTPDGKRVLISDIAIGELTVMDAATRKVTKRIKLGTLAEGIQITPDGVRAYVALEQDNEVAIVDLAKLSVIGRIKPGRGTRWPRLGGAPLVPRPRNKIVSMRLREVVSLLCLCAAAAFAADIPAGTELQLRFRQSLTSFASKRGETVIADVIAPVVIDGHTVLPLGTRVVGYVDGLRRVGLGLVRESASINVVFDRIEPPGVNSLALYGQIHELDNARETVDAQGRIRGIRATASFSSVISGIAVSAATVDPMLLAFGITASLSAFRIPESEIFLPAGAEFHFRLTQPLHLDADFPAPVPELSGTSALPLPDFVRTLPFRTATQTSGVPSDLTSLVFLGSRDAIERSFDAAGWSQTDTRNARSIYGTMRSIVENQGYREAPVSTLLLNGATPQFTFAKTLNTFFKRHHVRIFAEPDSAYGLPVWTASSTHDSGIGFAIGQKTFIHLIDENIDEEREKVVNDLILTGCVDSIALVDRPWVPLDATNSTGDLLKTDGRAAVVKLNECASPHRADAPETPQDTRQRPNVTGRVARDTLLTLRNDLLRGNFVYQGYEGVRMGIHAMRKSPDPGSTRTVTLGGQPFQIVRGATARNSKLAPDDRYDPNPTFHPDPSEPVNYQTFLEFSISGGYLRFGNDRFSKQTLLASFPVPGQGDVIAPLDAVTSLRRGWNLAANVTFNAHRHFSHELGFTLNKTQLKISIENPLIRPDVLNTDAQIRQFHYALLYHPVANGGRWRPYLALGPALQVIRTLESVQSSQTLWRFAFKELNAIYSAYHFGDDPPLEGGAIFQPALHYGGGIKFHWTRRFVLRADYRETLSAQPDFWTKSYPSLTDADIGPGRSLKPLELHKYGLLRQQRLSLGVGITF